MDREFVHVPVLAGEVVDLFAPVPAGLLVDATVGGGGHAEAVLAANPNLRVVGIDRDPRAVAAAAGRLRPFGARAVVVRARFDALGDLVRLHGAGAASGVLFDLGVSSPQLDEPGRGFSYRFEGPLDMRMDPGDLRSAADIVNAAPEAELARLFAANGERRFARRLARSVVVARPLRTTTDLTDAVRRALPAAVLRQRGHPARRVFQALRIAVNDELGVLAAALDQAVDILVPGGRVAVIAYHSGEDRLVKAMFADAVSGGCVCPPDLPCVCGAVPRGRLVFRGARRPAPEEVERNRRAESARLRVLERTGFPERR